ncbi:helix-turn-helix domain-containing protein [Thermovenabulum gondwanense]|nr:helix-turn-helix domain-containing protein [Thermovenabulum gondwanense]
MEMHTTIKTLFTKGYNKSSIARMLNIDRKTVRKVLKVLNDKDFIERKERISILDPYKEYIAIQVSKGLSAQRIYQDLKSEMEYSGSYDTVKNMQQKLEEIPLKPLWF